jgi:prefoldin subunit 5
MKSFNHFFISIITATLFFACGSSSPDIEKEDALRNEVFVIHDEVMPRMAEIVALKGKLEALKPDSTKVAEVEAAISFLVKAEDGMMEWMVQFKQPANLRESKKHEEIMAYLEAEKQRISQVRDDMNNSIKAAGQLLATMPKAE